jgi:hypothetical protein
MEKLSFSVKKINFFFLSLVVFVCSLPLSEFMVSVSGGILFLTALLEDNWKCKKQRFFQRKILLLIPAIFFIYVLSAVIASAGEEAFYDFRKALFFFILPVGFLLGKEISTKQKQFLLILFTIIVIIASIIAIVNWKIIGGNDNLEIHNASLITHIRFSFQLILSFWIILLFGFNNYKKLTLKTNLLIALVVIYLLGFLFIQQSLTGLVALISTLTFVLLSVIFQKKGIVRYSLLTIVLLILISPVVYIGIIAYPFFYPEKIQSKDLLKVTKLGNPYSHNINNPLIENGKYVYLFVCEDEMKKEWNNISDLKYDSLDQNGYQVKSTLVRYLTSRGLLKDAEGVRALTNQDVINVKKGISNYLLNEKKFSMYPRIYVTIWEYYVYTRMGYANNQSFSQRIEFSKAALSIIKENFWIGVGAGNWKQEFFNTYKKMDSSLQENYYASSHNQYLNYIVKFGIIGFCLIMFFLIYPIVKTKRYSDFLFLIFLVFMFVANFADSNFESHMGSSFFVFFYCLFLSTDGIDYLRIRRA